MSGDKVRILVAVLTSFALSCVVILAYGGQPLAVLLPSVDMATALQPRFMQSMQPTIPRASTQANANNPANIAGLTPCSTNKAFAKREKQALKELTKRMAKYDKDSVAMLALESTAARTKARFASFGKAGLLCGTDGYPHLISEPGLALKYNHAGEVLVPTVGFLLFSGWIGESGRLYLKDTDDKEKEIILDVPRALACLAKAWAWPCSTLTNLHAGTLTDPNPWYNTK